MTKFLATFVHFKITHFKFLIFAMGTATTAITLATAITTTTSTAFAGQRFKIGTSKIEAFQKQTPFKIDYTLESSPDGNTWTPEKSGQLCYSRDPNERECANAVGQTITAKSQEGTEVWEYSIGFEPPNEQEKVTVTYLNIHGTVTNGELSILVPNLLTASSTTTLEAWNETIFIAAPDQRLRLRARLIR